MDRPHRLLADWQDRPAAAGTRVTRLLALSSRQPNTAGERGHDPYWVRRRNGPPAGPRAISAIERCQAEFSTIWPRRWRCGQPLDRVHRAKADGGLSPFGLDARGVQRTPGHVAGAAGRVGRRQALGGEMSDTGSTRTPRA